MPNSRCRLQFHLVFGIWCTAFLLAMLAFGTLAHGQQASPPWWHPLWPYRVRIDCPASAGEAAQVYVTLAGRTTEDGRDLRLVDGQGRKQPFLIVHHDSQFQTLLVVKVPQPAAGGLWLYFGNQRADRIKTLQPELAAPAWQVRAGLILRVYRKAQPQYPKTLAGLLAMIDKAQQEGGAVVTNISHGHNPFGVSDQYISIYEGWLRIDRPGVYSFCSASADGSWVVINDKVVVEWPGPHGWGGSERGQINGSIELPAGVVNVRYYHEAGAGPQMAFMGWKPPGQERFTAIPPDQWVKISQAHASEYQAFRKSLMAVPQVEVFSTYWLPDTIGKQATMVHVQDCSVSLVSRIAQIRWDFGDGQTASGSQQWHVYFRLGRPRIELSVTDSEGNSDSVVCSPNIFLVDVQGGDVRVGRAERYAEVAAGYDLEKLPAQDLALYAEFWQRLEKWPQFVAAARAYLQRFGDYADAPRIAALAADACADVLVYDPNQAERFYAQALEKIEDAETRQSLLLRRARNLAWGLNRLEDAADLYRQAIEIARPGPLGRATVRSANIGLGDVSLLAGKLQAAKEQYAIAEKMTDRKALDQAAELAQLGSYPWAVEDYLARGEYEQAIETLDQWENTFPMQKLEGTSLLLRGKVLFVRQPCEPAVKYLELAEMVNPAGPQVPEAVWLRANCLLALGKIEQAMEQFARVSTEFTRSEFASQAQEKIAECEKRLKSSSSSR